MEAERHVRDALARTAILGLLIAGAVALVVALYVSVRVTRPVTALTSAVGDLAAGRRETRVDTDGPGELRTLAEAFCKGRPRRCSTASTNRRLTCLGRSTTR